ncbi:MAG: hypothetical protein WC703_06720 [Candidatus Neomarinimicrobiota bacterium]
MKFNRSTENTLVWAKEMVLPVGKFEEACYLIVQNGAPSKNEITFIEPMIHPKELNNE